MANNTELSALLHAWVGAFNRRDLDEYLSFYADDIVLHGYTPEPLAPSGVRDFYDAYLSSFEVASTIDEEIWDGDRMSFRWTANARQVNEYNGIAPSGKTISYPGLSVMHWKDGKIAERWSIQDNNYVESLLRAR